MPRSVARVLHQEGASMNIVRVAVKCSLAVFCLVSLASCAGGRRAMSGYYQNHPEMQKRLLQVRAIYVENVQGARDDGESLKMRECLIDELQRKGRGRFRLVRGASQADAVLEADMKEALGPVATDTPLPFELESKITLEDKVYVRIRLVDPASGRLVYKTDTREIAEFEVDSIEKAAHTVIKNLMREIDLATQAAQM